MKNTREERANHPWSYNGWRQGYDKFMLYFRAEKFTRLDNAERPIDRGSRVRAASRPNERRRSVCEIEKRTDDTTCSLVFRRTE